MPPILLSVGVALEQLARGQQTSKKTHPRDHGLKTCLSTSAPLMTGHATPTLAANLELPDGHDVVCCLVSIIIQSMNRKVQVHSPSVNE